MDTDISHLILNLKHRVKCKFALKLIILATTSDLFSLQVVQKCQHCQLYVDLLLENSTAQDVFNAHDSSRIVLFFFHYEIHIPLYKASLPGTCVLCKIIPDNIPLMH